MLNITDKTFQQALKKLKRNPLETLAGMFNDLWYSITCYFSPYNVIKIEKLPRSWCDRDHLMLHAMFQIIVDFVELEQPFVEWESKCKVKRFTDLDAMKRFVENKITPEGLKSYHYDGISDEEILKVDKRTHECYKTEKEILYLYEWYKNEQYEFKHDLQLDTLKTPLTSWQESFKLKEEHDANVAHMLQRILAVRDYLWT